MTEPGAAFASSFVDLRPGEEVIAAARAVEAEAGPGLCVLTNQRVLVAWRGGAYAIPLRAVTGVQVERFVRTSIVVWGGILAAVGALAFVPGVEPWLPDHAHALGIAALVAGGAIAALALALRVHRVIVFAGAQSVALTARLGGKRLIGLGRAIAERAT
jgi:hypothetical protein